MANLSRRKWQLAPVLVLCLLSLGLTGPGSQVTRQANAWAGSEIAAEVAVEPLAADLVNGGPAEIGLAARELGRMENQAAIDALLVPLADRQLTSSRHAAMAALEGIGEPAVAPLVGLLESEDATTRGNAAEMLGWIGSPKAAPWLVPLLADESAEVRARADWALRAIADQVALRARSLTKPLS